MTTRLTNYDGRTDGWKIDDFMLRFAGEGDFTGRSGILGIICGAIATTDVVLLSANFRALIEPLLCFIAS